ncbi:hypothetical protein BGZ58_001858 [Dissophora ornata]|nr:hypothetical protein BGZ58_001858 [Dissophora ornata]
MTLRFNISDTGTRTATQRHEAQFVHTRNLIRYVSCACHAMKDRWKWIAHLKQSVGASVSRRKASQSNTTSSNVASPELGSKSKSQSADGYVPVNNFNSQEVVNHFDRSWKAALDSYHQLGPSNVAKPEMYKGSETMAWGNKVAPKGAMSTGVDFLTELQRKQPSA